jgi:hypothetical protein
MQLEKTVLYLSIKIRGPVVSEQVVVSSFPQRIQDRLKFLVRSEFACFNRMVDLPTPRPVSGSH